MDPRGWCGETVYDPFKIDDFFMRPRPYKQPGEAINMGNPRNLYKKLLLDANQISSSFPLDESDKSVDCSAEFEAAKNLFQKNWRLHSASWTDYEKKKVTGSTGSYFYKQLFSFLTSGQSCSCDGSDH